MNNGSVEFAIPDLDGRRRISICLMKSWGVSHQGGLRHSRSRRSLRSAGSFAWLAVQEDRKDLAFSSYCAIERTRHSCYFNNNNDRLRVCLHAVPSAAEVTIIVSKRAAASACNAQSIYSQACMPNATCRCQESHIFICFTRRWPDASIHAFFFPCSYCSVVFSRRTFQALLTLSRVLTLQLLSVANRSACSPLKYFPTCKTATQRQKYALFF